MLDEGQPRQLRATMYCELAQYVAHKCKALEVIGKDCNPIIVQWQKLK